MLPRIYRYLLPFHMPGRMKNRDKLSFASHPREFQPVFLLQFGLLCLYFEMQRIEIDLPTPYAASDRFQEIGAKL